MWHLMGKREGIRRRCVKCCWFRENAIMDLKLTAQETCLLKTRVFWDVKLCRWVNNSRRFEATYCCHIYGQGVTLPAILCPENEDVIRFLKGRELAALDNTWICRDTAVRS